MGSEDVMEGSGGMGSKKVMGDGGGCVGRLGRLEGHDEEVSYCILVLPVEEGCLARFEGCIPRMDGREEGDNGVV
ncbi:hypothetical protein KI387_012948, partial [Taxus chinensis]